MDTQPIEEERLDQEAANAREKMLAGEDTPWSNREPHRGEAAYTEGGEYLDPVAQGPGLAGGGHGGTSGSHQVHTSATNSGGASGGGSHSNHGDDTPGAFGQETGGQEAFLDSADTRDNAIKKLQDL